MSCASAVLGKAFHFLLGRRHHEGLKIASPSQDVTPSEQLEADPKVDRDVTIFGYLRGTNLKLGAQVHIAGVGDYMVSFSTFTKAFYTNIYHLGEERVL